MTLLTAELRSVLEEQTLPGAAELFDALGDVLLDPRASDGPVTLQQLKSRVYRLRVGPEGRARSLVLKRFDPWLARRNELVARRWLPALGLGDGCPELLATAADRRGQWVWHVYEDLGDTTVDAVHPNPRCVAAVVDLVAQLHTRAASHTLLPECRHYCGDLGAAFFAANVRDAVAMLQALTPSRVESTAEQQALRRRLLARLYGLHGELPWRVRMLETLGGPDTLLHGDLWTTNAVVAAGDDGLTVRLIDWDHAAVGPVSYDLSTFLCRFPRSERPWIVDAYERAVVRAGWRPLPAQDLNVLCETAECARYANCVIWPALALLEERAAWGWDQLVEVERWFNALEPMLPV